MAEEKPALPPPANKTVEELRRVFTPMTSRLTIETESALVYTPATAAESRASASGNDNQ